MLDVLIRDAEVIDGRGEPARRGSVGVRDGRIVLDPAGEPAATVIDAEGLALAPGFVDIHTHYDPQVMWDGAATPSPLHGATTVIGGNCGFSIAPLREDTTDYLIHMMAVTEGLPLVSLKNAIDWNWDTFGQWLGRLEGRLAVNAGFLVGHNALRLAVMGPSAIGQEASAAQIAQMADLLRVSLEEGGLGFSTTQKTVHLDHNGDLVPSLAATAEELLALASVLRSYPGTSLEFASEGLGKPRYPEDDIKLMTEMSRRANRPINWNTVRIIPSDPEYAERQLSASDYAADHGGRIVGLSNPKPVRLRMSFGSGIPLNGLPGWAPVFGLEIAERGRALADPEVRRKLRATEKMELREAHQTFVRWSDYVVAEGIGAQTKAYEGRMVGDIAGELGRDPFDVFVDLGTADDLRTAFYSPAGEDTQEAWRERARVWRDPRVIVGGADAGAHVDAIVGATYATTLLGPHVRDRGLLGLEEAIHMLTDVPARFYGLTERGQIRDGWHADLVLFDPTAVGPGTEEWTENLPGGGGCLYAEPTGIERVFVNGREIVCGNKLAGEASGTVLRSGQHTAGVMV